MEPPQTIGESLSAKTVMDSISDSDDETFVAGEYDPFKDFVRQDVSSILQMKRDRPGSGSVSD